MIGSVSTILVIFAVTISLFIINVNSESFQQANNTKNLSEGRIIFVEHEYAMPHSRNHPKNRPMTTGLPASGNDSKEVAGLDVRYGIDAPPVPLIQCKENEKYQEGSCKVQSSLWTKSKNRIEK